MNINLNFKFDNTILKKQVVDFASTNYRNANYFICNGTTKARFYSKILDHSLDFVDELKQSRIDFFNRIGINEFEEDPYFGIFIGVNLEGGFVHAHKDMAKKGFVHTRLNFLLSKPYIGGNPIIENKEIPVDEDGSWLNLASYWTHGSTPVAGNKIRIVISYGAMVHKHIIDRLNFTL
jgi:hypothetical protein